MRQLLLDWGTDTPQTLATFVAGRNQELLQLLRTLTCRCGDRFAQRFAYLWGEAGAGKTHLLRALGVTRTARYIGRGADLEAFSYTPQVTHYLLDDCELLSADAQIAAFGLFNQVRENGGIWVAAGTSAPAALALREDLRTRLGWGLIYQVHGLSDDEKVAALSQAASARGFDLAPGVLAYLITHLRRDMRTLSATLDALDRYSLETKRPVTLPLLRNLLQQEGEAR